MKIAYKIIASITGAALLVGAALVIIVSFWSFRRSVTSSALREHSYLVINSAVNLLSDLKDAETGQRGYVLTGDDAFLEPYSAVRGTIPGKMEDLRKLALLPSAKKHLDTMEPLLSAKLAEMDRLIELRRKNMMPAAIAAIRSGPGKMLMDSIREEMRGFIKIEESAQTQREAEFHAAMKHLFLIIIGLSLLMLVCAVVLTWLIYNETHQQFLEVSKISEDATRIYSESIINTVREPLITLDQNLRVVSVSRSFYEVFKVNPEETLGQLIYDLGNKQWDIPKLRELLETILPQKTTFDNYEVEHNFATIGRRIMLLNARQIKMVLGKDRIILLAIEDITERRETENGLKTAHEKLEELTIELKRADRAKSEFLANMSHELRTPLNSIIGFSEVLYDETFGPLVEKQKKYANNILTSGKHLLLLINQILDMAKVEAGKMKLTLSILPIKVLLDEISMLVADIVSKKNLQMTLEIADDLPDIEADDLKLKETI